MNIEIFSFRQKCKKIHIDVSFMLFNIIMMSSIFLKLFVFFYNIHWFVCAQILIKFISGLVIFQHS